MSYFAEVSEKPRFASLKRPWVLWSVISQRAHYFDHVQTFKITACRSTSLGGYLYRLTDLGKEYDWVPGHLLEFHE